MDTNILELITNTLGKALPFINVMLGFKLPLEAMYLLTYLTLCTKEVAGTLKWAYRFCTKKKKSQ